MYQYVEGRDNMINPISFRAVEAPVLNPVKKEEVQNTEVVTNPISNEASFKGAEALAAYNKAILATNTNTEEATKAPAFKGEEIATEKAPKDAPAFRGEEPVEEQPAEKAPAFKGEETAAEEAPKDAPAFRGEETVEEQPAEKAPAFRGEETAAEEAPKDAPAFKGEEPVEEVEAETK